MVDIGIEPVTVPGTTRGPPMHASIMLFKSSESTTSTSIKCCARASSAPRRSPKMVRVLWIASSISRLTSWSISRAVCSECSRPKDSPDAPAKNGERLLEMEIPFGDSGRLVLSEFHRQNFFSGSWIMKRQRLSIHPELHILCTNE